MSDYLREALRKRRRRKIDWDALEENKSVQKDQSVSPGKISDMDAEEESDDTGQISAAKKVDIKTQGDDLIEKQAMEVLGRKPMSTTKKRGQDDEYEFEYGEKLETNPDVLDNMVDERVMDDLKSGRRKPKKLWDKVQLNIAKRIK